MPRLADSLWIGGALRTDVRVEPVEEDTLKGVGFDRLEQSVEVAAGEPMMDDSEDTHSLRSSK